MPVTTPVVLSDSDGAPLVEGLDTFVSNPSTSPVPITFVNPPVSPLRTTGIAVISVELQRPNDSTAYTALDAVSGGAVIVFPNVARLEGGSGMITNAQLITDQKTNVARFRLHLYMTPPTNIADNSPYLLLYADFNKRVGALTFPAGLTEDSTNSTGAYADLTPGAQGMPLPFVCASSDRSLYGLLEAVDAFTPAALQKIQIKLLVATD